MEEVQDLNRALLLTLFEEPAWSADQFIARLPMLHSIKQETSVHRLFLKYVHDLELQNMRFLINQVLQQDNTDEK
jgi:hypothetical protein